MPTNVTGSPSRLLLNRSIAVEIETTKSGHYLRNSVQRRRIQHVQRAKLCRSELAANDATTRGHNAPRSLILHPRVPVSRDCGRFRDRLHGGRVTCAVLLYNKREIDDRPAYGARPRRVRSRRVYVYLHDEMHAGGRTDGRVVDEKNT